MLIHDISPIISENIAVFPGDKSFSRNISCSFEKGNSFVLSSISGTVHLGAHTDAPNHYHPDGVGIDQRDLDYYLGGCQVIEVSKSPGERITLKDLEKKEITKKRVLFKTKSFEDPNNWNDDFNSLSPEVIEFLSNKGVILVGIDTPSVDPSNDEGLSSHNKIFEKNMAILEGIVLTKVPEGTYKLIALPLKIKEADASPVRAILVEGEIL